VVVRRSCRHINTHERSTTKANNNNLNINQQVQVEMDKTILISYQIDGIAHQVIMDSMMRGEKPETVLKSILDLGGTMLMHGANKATVDSVSSEVDRLIETIVGVALTQYPGIIEEQSRKLKTDLEQYLDPEKNTSMQSQMKSLMADFIEKLKSEVAKTLIEPNSPITAMRREFVERFTQVDSRYGNILQEVTTLSERVTSSAELRKERGKGTAKGVVHEAVVVEVIERVCAPFNDIVTDVSQEVGSSARKTGDFVVQLESEQHGAGDLRFVVEAKNTKMTLANALKELELSMKNREAIVGVLVFNDMGQAPTNGQPFRLYPGNRIIVTFQDENSLPVEVAIAFARMLTQAKSSNELKDHSVVDLNELARKITTLLEDSKSIIKNISVTRKAADEIEDAYKLLRDKLLIEIKSMLSN